MVLNTVAVAVRVAVAVVVALAFGGEWVTIATVRYFHPCCSIEKKLFAGLLSLRSVAGAVAECVVG